MIMKVGDGRRRPRSVPTPSLVEAVAPLGHEGAHPGQGRWNGEAVLSRAGLDR